MANTTQRIRKVDSAAVADFDDQLWPINVAILIFAGFVVGVVIALSDFGEPRILYNGWTHLGVVALLVAGLFWAVRVLQGRVLRRVQLCILISLIVHLWLAMYLHEQFLALLLDREEDSVQQAAEQFEQITVPDYNWQQVDRPEVRQTFEEPLETEAPEPQEPEAVRRETDDPDVPLQETAEEPQPVDRQQPDEAVARRRELTAPRRADQAAGAQVSRQEWKHRPRANEPIPEPELKPQPRRTAALPTTEIAPRQRETTPVEVDQQQTFEEVASPEPTQLEVQMARRATPVEPSPRAPSTPAPSRQVRRPAEIPRSLAAAPEPVPAAERSQQTTPKAAEQMAARREAAAPQVVRPAAQPEPEPSAPNAVAQAAARQRRVESVPQASRSPRPVPSRQSREVRTPTEAARPEAEALAAAVPRSQPSADAAQLAADVRRSAPSTNPSDLPVNQEAASVVSQPGPTAVVENPVRRASTPVEPTAEPAARSPARRVRPTPTPQVAAAEAAPAPPAAAPADSPRPSDVAVSRPAAAAVSRTAEPSPDTAAEQVAGQEIPAMTDVVQLPAEAAPRRARSAQQAPRGADAAPSRPAGLARSSPGANLPSTLIPSEAAPAAAASAGASAPSRIAQTGPSAAVRRDGGQPTPDAQGPAAGSAELAIGSSTAVARSGQPRAEGMGRPSASANADRPQIARSSAPVRSSASSAAPEGSPATPGAVASTATGPTTPSFNLRSSAASRGGTVRQLTAQPTVGSGPPGPSGTPGPIGAASRSRVTRHEALESAIAGGGTPRPGRTVGGVAAPNAQAAPSAVAGASAPSGGRASEAPPLEAPVSGPRREVAGLPGNIESQPAAGASASLTAEGEPLALAMARRIANPSRATGESESAAARDMTRRKKRLGNELPTVAETAEPAAQAGMGGVAMAEGGQPSTLPQGTAAAVRTAAADLPPTDATEAAGAAEEGLGTATAVALAGRVRPRGDEAPNLAAATEAREPARRAALATPGGAAPAEALAAVPNGSAAGSGEQGPEAEAVAGVASKAVARGAGGVPDARPSEDQVAAVAPGGGAIASGPRNRAVEDDRLAAAAPSGATAGPRRTMGAIQTPGTTIESAEMAQAGPTPSGGEAGLETAPVANLAGTERLLAGMTGPTVDQPPIEGATQPGPAASTPGTVAGPRRLPTGDESEPTLAAAVGRGPLKRTAAPGLPRGVAEAVAEQMIASAATPDTGDALEVARGMGRSEPSRQEGGLPVQIAAAPGPGGLGFEPSPEVGLPSRRARPESDVVHTVSRRFVIERSGGRLAIDGRVRAEPAEAYSNRKRGRRAQVAQELGGTSGTEYAVEVGLDFFARHQFPDGHWSLNDLPEGVEYDDPGLGEMKSDTAATGLALLTYLGAGYTHLDDKHRAVVDKGIDWLVRHQKPNGDLFAMADGSEPTKYAWFYSHGIAAIALCEAYGMTHDPKLRDPAVKAIEFIVNTQHPTRGGWRYSVDENGRATETDTSVTGWQLMALKSAQMAGLEVPPEVLEKIGDWLERAEAPKPEDRGQYVYNPYALDTIEQRQGRRPNLAMTAEAMLMRMYLGAERDDPLLVDGADYLAQNLPQVGTAARPERNVYYWYYATQAMFQMQGDYWTAWNDALRPLTLAGQEQTGEAAGSWDPVDPVRDRWGHAGGRLYVTAMHLLMLEVYYRHLPLFQELRK